MGFSDIFKGSKSKAPDLSFLSDPSKFSYLRQALTSGNIDTSLSDQYFIDLIRQISAPSSVDEVQRGVDSDLMRQLLVDVDKDARQSTGTLSMDLFDRGLEGPGVSSDIGEIAKAQLAGDADRTRAGVRGEFANRELDRLKNRELMAAEAFGNRFGFGADLTRDLFGANANRDLSYADILNQRDLTRAGLMTDIYRSSSKNDRRSDFGNFFRSGADSFADSFFKSFGSKLGG